VTAGAIGHHWRTEVLLTLSALPPACDRHIKLRTPELADLREATRADCRDISRTESISSREFLCEGHAPL
jgi:hypothetical protein